jgi:16S rRNA (uracil1498-N3)-methyltransferase
MSHRYFCERPINTENVTLDGPEAHHLLHVLRAAPGQEVTLFDGSGWEFRAEIVDCGRREARLRVVSSQEVSREARLPITLGVALPKGERQRWLVEKAVELGAERLVPLVTERGVAQPTPTALVRLRRAVIEASKQCGRTRLMEVTEPLACRDYLAGPFPQTPGETLRVCAHPGGEKRLPYPTQATREVKLAVGPEGGFTEEEIAIARDQGWLVADLGPTILRVETAALALAAVFTLGERPE